MKSHQGFTLIELLMVLAILSVLFAFAVPSYQEYSRKKDRAALQQEMQRIAMELERHKGKNFSYALFSTATVNFPIGAVANKQTHTIRVTDGAGQSLTANNANGFAWRIYAERKNVATQAREYDLLMTSAGIRCMTKTKDVVKNAGNANCGNKDSENW